MDEVKQISKDEYSKLLEKVERLELENQTLKLEQQLSAVYRNFDTSRKFETSTPRHHDGRTRLDIPYGRPDDTSEGGGLSLLKEMDKRPDRFVTERRKKHTAIVTDNETSGTKHDDLGNKRTAMMKPATYDGSTEWTNYKAHFEACAQLNGWTEEQKGLYLSLRGQAQGVFRNLGTKTTEYKDLVRALEDRFSPPNQTELYRVQLRDRKQKATESMAELGQDIRRLTNLAYASAPTAWLRGSIENCLLCSVRMFMKTTGIGMNRYPMSSWPTGVLSTRLLE